MERCVIIFRMEKNNGKQKVQALKEILLQKLNTNDSLLLDELKAEHPPYELNQAMRALAKEQKAAVWRRFLKKADGQNFRFATGVVKQKGPSRFIFDIQDIAKPAASVAQASAPASVSSLSALSAAFASAKGAKDVNSKEVSSSAVASTPASSDVNDIEAYIGGKASKGVLDGDLLSCFIVTSQDGQSIEAFPTEVLRRPKPQVWARAKSIKNENDGQEKLIWEMDGRVDSIGIELDSAPANAKAGDLWRVRISEHGLLRFNNKATVLSRLGNQDDAGIESKFAYISRFEQRPAAPSTPKALSEATDTAKRADYRSMPLVTIDGESTKDFDDAVFAKEHEDGHFTLSVHIADVSAFVPVGSPLDQYAQLQMTSVYLPHQVHPMLPESLANGMSSLNPQEDRYSLACQMEVSAEGEVTSIQFERALMHSAARLTYTQAQRAFDGEDIGVTPEVARSLDALSKVATALRTNGFEKGRFDMGDNDLSFKLNDQGKVEKLVSHARLWSEKVIEEVMLAANKAAATLIAKQLPAGVFRNHWGMSETDTQTFIQAAQKLGLADLSAAPTSYDRLDFVRVLEKAKEAGVYGQMRSELLGRLSSAQYQSNNEGHYSLAADAYCHFTSPIRRYPDLICHRLIKSVIDGTTPDYTPEELSALAEKATVLSSQAGQTEGDARKLLLCDYLDRLMPLAVESVVQSVGERGAWMTLSISEGKVDQFCPSKTLKDAGWVWQSEGFWLDDQQAQVKEGHPVELKVSGINRSARRIEVAPNVTPVARPSISL